jgi:glutamyl-Q tRNA(Asp) synthetase
MTTPVFRFAPSPNGYLHLGHACSALLNFDMAREMGGRLLLRIEDIDTARCRPEFEAAIYEDLAKLEERRLTFPSFESRAEIARMVADRDVRERWPRDPDGVPVYPGAARQLKHEERQARIARGEPYAIRLDMSAAIDWTGPLNWWEIGAGQLGEGGSVGAHPADWGDVILARKETPTSYHLSVAVDDAAQGVTHVVRGADLYRSTDVHRQLQALLDLPPPIYCHHGLILDDQGRKLSKSTQATGLRELRAQGVTVTDIRKMVEFKPIYG